MIWILLFGCERCRAANERPIVPDPTIAIRRSNDPAMASTCNRVVYLICIKNCLFGSNSKAKERNWMLEMKLIPQSGDQIDPLVDPSSIHPLLWQ